jgi:hypothetical protein
MVNWINKYLKCRVFRVKAGKSHSNSQPIQKGVPQGPVLSPNLFSIFINDILIKDQKYGNLVITCTQVFCPIKTANNKMKKV